ncbi:hypothetical protein [Rhodopirellula sp. MGV]|uniref:hypothetical protein n=1 Tax=Rhodopirellula sp. MGV TaxID=2023130 RepID=UPI00117BD745|nr:hypothetical protein [Rhodopirellula sp. MGV]
MACPKCQSMVQLSRSMADVVPPIAIGDRPVDSDAITKDSFSSEPPLPDPGQAAQPGFGAAKTTAPPPVVGDSDTVANLSGAAPSGFADPSGLDTFTDDGADGTNAAAPPSEFGSTLDWQSNKSAKSRRLVVIALSSVAAILSIIILLTVLLRDDGNGQVTLDNPAERPGQSESDQANTDDSSSAEIDDVDGQPSVAETPTEPAESDATDVSDTDTNIVEPDQQTDTETSQPTDPPGNPSAIPGDLLPQNPLLPDTPLLPDNPLLPGNPLDGFNPAQPATPGGDRDEGPEAPTLTELPDALKPFLVGMDIDRPHLASDAPAPKTIDEIELDRAASDDFKLEVAVAAPTPVNLTAALGVTIAFQPASPDGYPLGDFAMLLSQMTGVPIDVEWISFDLTGTPLTTPVPLPVGKWVDIEEALTSACEAIGASFEKQPYGVRVHPLEDRFAAVLTDAIDLSDLDDHASAVKLARQLLRQTDENVDAVQVPVELGPKQLSVLVCEAIRRVRGKPGKVSDENVSRWLGSYESQVKAWPELSGGDSGGATDEPLAMSSLIRRIARTNGATSFVNWLEVSKRALGPGDLMMPKMGPGVSAADALAEVLAPEGLQVRVCDAKHWWVGTQAYFDRLPVVVWVDDASKANKFLRVAEGAIGGAAIDQQFTASVAIDPVSGKCLAVLPRFLLRQMPRLMSLD